MLNRHKYCWCKKKVINYQLVKKEKSKISNKKPFAKEELFKLGHMELPWSDATKPPEGVAMVPVSQDPKMTRGIKPAKWYCYGSGSTKPPNDSKARRPTKRRDRFRRDRVPK